MTVHMRQARPHEIDTMVSLRRKATDRLAYRGLDQWVHDFPDTPTLIAGFQRDLDEGATWFAVDEAGVVIACVTVNDRTDPGLWSPEEEASALFVHRMTRDPKSGERGVGALLLDHAAELAEQAGKEWVRLDAWTTNTSLHRYYLRQGFRYVRTVEGHSTPSAACFERPAAYRTPPKVEPSTGWRSVVCDAVMQQARQCVG